MTSEAATPTTVLTPTQKRRVEELAERVTPLARRLAPSMPQVNVDDLVSAGNEGLVQAALRYDPTTEVPFAAFAHYRIRGAMIDYARRAVPAVRQRSRAQRAMESTQAVLKQAQREQLALDAQCTRDLKERVQAAADVVAQATAAIVLSKLTRVDPDRVAGRRAASAEDEVLSAELRTLLSAAVADCSDDDRALIDALYFDGHSMHEWAEMTGKSVSTISRRHSRLMKRLSTRLKNRLSR